MVVSCNLLVICFILLMGFPLADPANLEPFMPFGARGMFSAASIVFFGSAVPPSGLPAARLFPVACCLTMPWWFQPEYVPAGVGVIAERGGECQAAGMHLGRMLAVSAPIQPQRACMPMTFQFTSLHPALPNLPTCPPACRQVCGV